MNERNIINFLALLFVVIGVIAFGSTVFSVTSIDQELDHAQGSHAASLNHLLALNEDFADSVQESFAYVVSGEIEEKQEAIAIQSGLAARLHEAQHALAHGHAGGAEHTRYEGLEQQLPELQQAAAAMYAEYEATGGVSGGTFHAYEAKVDAIGTSLDQLIATAQADADRAREQTVAAVAAAEWLVLGQGAAVIIVVLVAAFIASRVLRRVFESRAQALDDIKIHRQAIESAPLGITFADAQRPHLPLVYTNATFEEMTGFRARDGVATDSSDDSIMAKVQAAVQAGQEVQTRIEGVGPTGERFTADLTVTPVHDEEGELVRFVVIVQDVTERLDLEAQLRQSQKMDAVGQLAGGIAHDFNNYLTVINGTASLLAEGYVDDAEQCGREILEAGERSADLTRQILAFARKQILAPQPHDLNQIVRAIVPLMRKTVREDLALQTDFTTHPVTASVDRSQVEQVITNLVLNARDATQPGGTVTISTAMTELPEGHTRAGRWATLAVTDNGTGIDPSIRETLFEPFVTTKGPGEGTGLGLSTVYGIAEQSGGWIELDTEPGVGTTVAVHFPAVDDAPITEAPPGYSTSNPGAGTVLLVEDDTLVRPFVSKTLRRLGYEVIEAEHGARALEILGERPNVDLILTDVTMPEMGGLELAEHARERHPDVRLLFMSGYPQESVATHGLRATAEFPLIQKPFTAAELQERVLELLGAK